MNVIHLIASELIIMELSNKSLESFQKDPLFFSPYNLFPALGLRRTHFLCLFYQKIIASFC